jgi:signal transduction histidine kinase
MVGWAGLRRPAVRTVGADAVLAAMVTVALFAGTAAAAGRPSAVGHRPPDLVADLLFLTAGAALVLRRLRPLSVLLVVVGVCSGYLARGYPYGPLLFTMVIAMYTVATALPAWRSALACATGFVAVAVGEASAVAETAPQPWPQQVAWTGWLVVPWLVGLLVRRARETVRQADEDQARHSLVEERLRTAREVHDVVGHGLAVISLQSGVALHVLQQRPEQAQAALAVIRRTSTAALGDLRLALSAIRDPDAAVPSGLAAVPSGLAAVPTLAEQVTTGELRVEVEVCGRPEPLPPAADLAAYRVVQEALTNVVRHAVASRVAVQVAHGPAAVVVSVVNDGAGRPPDPADPPGAASSTGSGLAGLRERVASVGGTLEAAPRDGGGFRVAATFPRPAPEADRRSHPAAVLGRRATRLGRRLRGGLRWWRA